MSASTSENSREFRLIGPSDDGGIGDLLSNLSGKESRQRLQALIAQWLGMENLVVLTGAGTSVSAGGKIMRSLEHSVLDAVNLLPDATDSIRALILARKKDVTTKVGFEEWLSYLVSAKFFGSMPSSPFDGVKWRGSTTLTHDELSWFVDKVGNAIFAECALALPEAKDASPHLAFLAKLVARDSNLGRAHLFTLNYDTLFEQALELLGIQYFDGFTGRADARFDPSVYGLDIYYPGEISEGRVRRFDKFLHLYKLHGSIHWQIRDNEIRARHPDLSTFSSYGTLTSKQKAELLGKRLGDFPTAGILPTTNKFVQTLALPFAHIFRSFQIRLAAPQTFLLVLGYGFGDDHVTRILETALMNPSLVMLVVEPDPRAAIVERISAYKELGKRVFALTPTQEKFDGAMFECATFDNFATSLMPDVQWLDDFLRLRQFERQIFGSGALAGGMKSGADGKP